MAPYSTAEIADYKQLVNSLPYLEQAFETKKNTWERECQQSELFRNFCNRIFAQPTVKISRADVFDAASGSFRDGLFTLILWGYPRNMRGNTVRDILGTETLEQLEAICRGDKELSAERFTSICKELNGTGIGLSTLTKILYFFRFKLEGIPCLIFDRRIIEVFNSQVFSELSALSNITDFNKCSKYYDYLKTIREISVAQGLIPEQLELFLFQFGKNLKPVDVSGSLV